jgi:hypothetical protein
VGWSLEGVLHGELLAPHRADAGKAEAEQCERRGLGTPVTKSAERNEHEVD